MIDEQSIDEVRYDERGAVAVVTIDRQHRRNAIDGRTAQALSDALDRFEAAETARVMVLTGAGEAFCAGADLTAIASLAPRANGPDGPLGFTRRTASKPTIAAIDGWAVAGGLELALWCDLRVASARARFGCLERRWGVPLIDGGTWRLPRIVGMGRALYDAHFAIRRIVTEFEQDVLHVQFHQPLEDARFVLDLCTLSLIKWRNVPVNNATEAQNSFMFRLNRSCATRSPP